MHICQAEVGGFLVYLYQDREELKALFDKQIDSMLTLIDGQFDKMQRKHPGVQIVGYSP